MGQGFIQEITFPNGVKISMWKCAVVHRILENNGLAYEPFSLGHRETAIVTDDMRKLHKVIRADAQAHSYDTYSKEELCSFLYAIEFRNNRAWDAQRNETDPAKLVNPDFDLDKYYPSNETITYLCW